MASLPEGTYCICPDHDLLMPYCHVHWEWNATHEGCPVLVGEDERCGQAVQVTTRSELLAQRDAEWHERLLGDEAVEAAVIVLSGATYLESLDEEERRNEIGSQAMAIEAALDKAAPDGGGEHGE